MSTIEQSVDGKKVEMTPEIQEKIKDASKVRLERCLPAVAEIMSMLASEQLVFGEITDQERKDVYSPLSIKVIDIMLKHGLLYTDTTFVMQLLRQPIEEVSSKADFAIKHSFEVAMEKKWKDILDISLQDIDDVLKV